ncbi:ABC-type cobalamin/Fe3+-siderophores transport system ATPase subunit [Streptomyces sp. HB372]|nr:ABC-type cobalamin/Fe3+-siderophores transport system ATPase subunit [Streptomyces sp. HB372]
MAAQFTARTEAGVQDVPRLAARGITVGYGDRTVIEELDVAVPPGVITTIIGPNGCGKSTLLRTLSRLLKPAGGSVVLDGEDIGRLRTRDVAKKLGLLPQAPVAPEGLTVADLVARGRHPHQSWLRQWSSDDADVVRRALAMTGVADLADRPVDSLSGGQRQRVWISMTLAQGTDLLLLETSRPPTWTWRTRSTYSTWSTICTSRAAPSSWSCTTSIWPRATATTSSSCGREPSWRRDTPGT